MDMSGNGLEDKCDSETDVVASLSIGIVVVIVHQAAVVAELEHNRRVYEVETYTATDKDVEGFE
jgi:hypothetical protein